MGTVPQKRRSCMFKGPWHGDINGQLVLGVRDCGSFKTEFNEICVFSLKVRILDREAEFSVF